MFSSRASGRDVGDLGVGLLGSDDRARDDRLAGAQRRRDEAAAAEPLQLVPVGERLADPLEALRPHADELAVGQQALRVRVAGQRAAVLAAELADDRQPEHQVRAEHAQVPVRGVVVVQRDRGHQRVERDGAGVVGDDQRPALVGDVVQAGGLDPEPRPVQRPQQREDDVVGELGVEAELVDGVVAGRACGAGTRARRRARPPSRAGARAPPRCRRTRARRRPAREPL